MVLAVLVLTWMDEFRAIVKKRNKRRKIVSIEDPTGPGKWLFPPANNQKKGHLCSFTTVCINEKLKRASPHLLRHMWDSYLLNDGIDIATISAGLGHSNKSFTVDTYIHEINAEKEKTAIAMDNLIDKFKTQNAPAAQKGQA